jgi:hypothetical protein
VSVSIESVPSEIFGVPDSAQGKFSDTLDVDVDARRLYIGDNWTGGIDVFDIASAAPQFLNTIKLRGRIYGVAVAPEVGKVFAGMSGSTLAAVTLGPEKATVELVHTGGSGHVDLIDYDAANRRIFAANRLDGILTTVDAGTNRVTGRLDGLGHGLEQPRFNSKDRMVYLTDNVENVLYKIDPDQGRLVETFKLSEPSYPNGMAISPRVNHAVLACSKGDPACTVVWDIEHARIASVIKDLGGADGVVYEPSIDRFLVAASGAAGGPVIGIVGGDPIRLLAKISSAVGASWVGFDSKTNAVYAPAVDEGRPALLRFTLPNTSAN